MGPKGVLGAGFAILSGVMTVLLLWEFAEISRIAWQGIDAEGVVVEQRLRVNGASSSANAPVVAFTDLEGREHRFEARLGTVRGINPNRTTHPTGQRVMVTYLADRPEEAVIRGFAQHWVFLAWACVSALFTAMGLWFVRRDRREMRELGW